MFKIPEDFPKPLQQYYEVMVQYFLHEWRYLRDVNEGRTQACTDFTDRNLNVLIS